MCHLVINRESLGKLFINTLPIINLNIKKINSCQILVLNKELIKLLLEDILLSSELNKFRNLKLSSKINTKILFNKLILLILNFNSSNLNSSLNPMKMIDCSQNFNPREDKTNNLEHVLWNCNKKMQEKCHKVEC